ncbi:MAG: hypothetical protein WC606_03715 [Candidatus Absconditabacterales bacterium]
MKSKKGNISILVIFVLLASSLLGILSMNFVQQMMQQSAVVNSYYKTYYLSKAGIELGFSAIKHRGVGFEYMVNTGSDIVSNNFFSEHNFSLSISISGTASLLSKKFWQESGSGCTYPYVLSGGESLIIPLFRDNYTGPVAGSFEPGIYYQNLADLFKNDKIQIETVDSPDSVTFGLLILSGEDLYENGIFFRSGSLNTNSLNEFRTAFETYMMEINPTLANDYGSPQFIEDGFKIYFMISNTAQTQQSFCLQTVSTPLEMVYVLPTDTFFLQSQASYGNQQVALDASYAQPIPGFLFTTYSSYQ